MGSGELLSTLAQWERQEDAVEQRIERELRALAFIKTQKARVIGELAAQNVLVFPAIEASSET